MRGRLGPVALLLACSATPSSQPPVAPRSSPAMPAPSAGAPPPGRATINAQCVRCHPREADSWSSSLHRASWIDPDFARVQAREPSPFCRSCHAPEADPSHEPAPELAALGVACVTCHIPPAASLPHGAVLAGPTPSREPSPHPIVRSAAFTTASACASCHEFDSPESPELALQTTVSEHAASPLSRTTCQQCHMPERDHAFAASRSEDMLRSAIVATASRPARDRVEIALEAGRVGHAFPTGDPFRRLVVELGVDAEILDGEILTRTIEDDDDLSPARVVTHDNRIGATDFTPTLTFDVPADANTIWWRVVYERVDTSIDVDDPDVFDRIAIASGTLTAEPP